MFGEETVEGEDLYKISKELFSRNYIDNQRSLAVRMFFDRSRAHLPTIHLSLPAESGGKNDGMGLDIGYAGEDINEDLSESRKYLTRKSSIYAGLVKVSKDYAKTTQSQYVVFRRVGSESARSSYPYKSW